jgi:hypothetical protein
MMTIERKPQTHMIVSSSAARGPSKGEVGNREDTGKPDIESGQNLNDDDIQTVGSGTYAVHLLVV